MIEKVSFLDTSVNCVDYNGHVHNVAEGGIINKLNELVDAVNGILAAQEQYATIYNEDIVPMLTPQNEEPDFITTTYVTDGHTKEYYGQNGASVVTDHPLPAGYVITIREPETKGE